ncbi:MAG TPA: helix-turn-helix domain-containing protein [Candidatus Paceibacterota bacterium]
MSDRKLGKRRAATKNRRKQGRAYPRPAWVPRAVSGEGELCPDCFRVVGERSRYSLVCMLGRAKKGMTVGELTRGTRLRQPTVTYHLQVLGSVDAVRSLPRGRERVYRLNRSAHCFEECKIPY